MNDMTQNFEKNEALGELSEEELRKMVARKRDIEDMSREELMNELLEADLTPKTKGLEIHPKSRLAALSASPEDSFRADFEANPMWFNILGILFFIFIIWGMFQLGTA